MQVDQQIKATSQSTPLQQYNNLQALTYCFGLRHGTMFANSQTRSRWFRCTSSTKRFQVGHGVCLVCTHQKLKQWLKSKLGLSQSARKQSASKTGAKTDVLAFPSSLESLEDPVRPLLLHCCWLGVYRVLASSSLVCTLAHPEIRLRFTF